MKFFLPAALALALTACGSSDPVAESAENTTALPANIGEPAPAIPAPDGSPPENATAAAAPVTGDGSIRIPAFLQGRWGMTPADCTSARGDAKGLLVIDPGHLRFYESVAIPVGNTNASDDSFSADYRFTGEGQTWQRFESLQLQDKRLVRTTSNPMASYTYAKCS
jgi:hypothetical protein